MNRLEVFWEGAFSWPQYEEVTGLPKLPTKSGVYLQTFQYKDGYLIYAAGITRRPVKIPFREHTRHYMNGEYNVLDVLAVEQGFRKEIWHGWGYAKKHRDQFEKRKIEIQDAVRTQLSKFHIFIAEIGAEPRYLERIEASIMNHLSKQSAPYCEIPDKDMMLAPRWENEERLYIINQRNARLHGLPDILEI